VYFYPKDDTPGCTVEAQGLRDVYPDLREAGVTVIGVSTQGAASHQAFIDAHDLPFPLAVNGEAAAQAFGVPMRAGMTARHSFLLADGKVARVWREVDPSEHAGEVLEAARARG
jgi:peroxiredoxin Q/BCP